MVTVRFLLAVAVSLALTATIGPVANGTVVVPDSTSSAPQPRHTDSDDLSAGEKSGAQLGNRLNHYSVTASGTRRSLNYVKANTYDQGHVVFRRRFAAGFEYAGGKLTHISSAELARVRHYEPKLTPSTVQPTFVGGQPYCTGDTKVKKYSADHVNLWLDSCKTKLLVEMGTSVGLIAGAAAAMFPLAAPFLICLLTVVGLGVVYLDYLSSTSAVNAIIVKYFYTILSAVRQ